MQRLLEMCVACALLYAAYSLTLKNWSYASGAQYEALRTECKRRGMSNVYYFIAAPTLFLFNLLTGGTFILYWTYQQWKAVSQGFRRLEQPPVAFNPWLRTLLFPFSFYTLNAVINRTCLYLHKKPTFAAWFWGTVWLIAYAGMAAAPVKLKPWFYLLVCAVPAVLQRRLNALPKTPVPLRPKLKETAAALCGMLVVGLFIFLLRRP